MKTRNLFEAIIVAVVFMATYAFPKGMDSQKAHTAKSDAGNIFADSSISNHNHGNSQKSDSAMMGQSDMMAIIQKCQIMSQKMKDGQRQMRDKQCCEVKVKVTNKNDNSFVDPGTKKGSYGYFQYQRDKNRKIDGYN